MPTIFPGSASCPTVETHIAVCLGCGGMKTGPWIPCPSCGHAPQTHEDLARHRLLSDAYQSRAELEEASARIRRGKPITFDEAALRTEMERISGGSRGGLPRWVVPLTALAGLLALAAGAVVARRP